MRLKGGVIDITSVPHPTTHLPHSSSHRSFNIFFHFLTMPRVITVSARQDLIATVFPVPLLDENVPSRRELSLEMRYFIAGMFVGGSKSAAQISRELHIPVSTIKDTIAAFRTGGLPKPVVRPGRPRKMTERTTRLVVRHLLKYRRSTAQELANSVSHISPFHRDTVTKAIVRLDFASRIAAKKPYLKPVHKANRLAFARKYEKWTVEDWKKVIWTDESSFEIGKNSRQIRVWRRTFERYHIDCLASTFKSGRTSIMVWGAFCGDMEKCKLILIPKDKRTAADYVEYVYENALSAYYLHADNAPSLILMEDGAPTHRSNLPKTWREAYGIDRLVWPAQSPDLNPIENVWRLMKAWISLKPIPANENEMWKLVEAAWEHVSRDFLDRLVQSMPMRMSAVIAAGGGATRW